MPVRPEPAYESLQVPTFTKTRDVSVQLHAYLRHLIIDEVLPAGTTLNQADLARRLGVSRIPMREAFRMLQQEGLIDVQLNQRATIRELSVHEVESLYGTRIVLESLGTRITAGHLSDDEYAHGIDLLEQMSTAIGASDGARWMTLHRDFHALCSARTDEPLSELIRSLSERTERYLRLVQRVSHPDTVDATHREHRAIIEAVHRGDAASAGALMADHLTHVARIVVLDLAQDAEGAVDDGPIHHASAMSGGGTGPGRSGGGLAAAASRSTS